MHKTVSAPRPRSVCRLPPIRSAAFSEAQIVPSHCLLGRRVNTHLLQLPRSSTVYEPNVYLELAFGAAMRKHTLYKAIRPFPRNVPQRKARRRVALKKLPEDVERLRIAIGRLRSQKTHLHPIGGRRKKGLYVPMLKRNGNPLFHRVRDACRSRRCSFLPMGCRTPDPNE